MTAPATLRPGISPLRCWHCRQLLTLVRQPGVPEQRVCLDVPCKLSQQQQPVPPVGLVRRSA